MLWVVNCRKVQWHRQWIFVWCTYLSISWRTWRRSINLKTAVHVIVAEYVISIAELSGWSTYIDWHSFFVDRLIDWLRNGLFDHSSDTYYYWWYYSEWLKNLWFNSSHFPANATLYIVIEYHTHVIFGQEVIFFFTLVHTLVVCVCVFFFH